MTQLQKSGGWAMFWSFWIVFHVKKIIKENILNSDPAPEVGGGGEILVVLNELFSGEKIY